MSTKSSTRTSTGLWSQGNAGLLAAVHVARHPASSLQYLRARSGAPAGAAAEPCANGQASINVTRKQPAEQHVHAGSRLPPHPEGEEELPGARRPARQHALHRIVTVTAGLLTALADGAARRRVHAMVLRPSQLGC